MDLIIKKAFIQMLEDSINQTPDTTDICLKEGYLSKIEVVFSDGVHYTISFVSSKEFLTILSLNLVGICADDDLEYRDLSQELANLTVGLAKVLAIKKGLFFDIKIPQVFGYTTFEKDRSVANFALKGTLCSLYIH